MFTFYSISSSVCCQNITCRAPFLYPQEVESFSKLNWKFDECLYALPKGNFCMFLLLSFLWILPWIIPIERLWFALISEWYHLSFLSPYAWKDYKIWFVKKSSNWRPILIGFPHHLQQYSFLILRKIRISFDICFFTLLYKAQGDFFLKFWLDVSPVENCHIKRITYKSHFYFVFPFP